MGGWGADEEPVHARPEVGPPRRADELPVVRAQRAERFFLLDDAPVWVSLPWAWPPEHRRWTQDHSTRSTRGRVGDGPWQVHPWTVWDHVEHERDADELLAEVGVPPRPPGRLWLLRPPARFVDLAAALDALVAAALERGAEHRLDADLHAALVAVLDGWVEQGWA